MRKWHLVSYDVRDERRLRLVAKLLEGYGERVQYSVFRCRLSPTEMERLRWELAQVVAQEDSVLFFPLCRQCTSRVSGMNQKNEWDMDPVTFILI
jgi:CRISPR-associated protein Cas2